MTTQDDQALEYASKNRTRFLDELKQFISIPSISTNPAARLDMQRAAQWVADQLINLGMTEVEVMPTGGHPIVFGESLIAGPDKPTVLIYGHYDVQPAEPLELWNSPAFSPTQRGENLYGRGASDMKGQIVVSLKSLESLVQTVGWPINVKFLIEGEEEIGSPNLEQFIISNKERLACDFAINPDAGMISADLPTITYGLRGLAYFELRVSGPQQDLHSGLFGGAIHNPAQVLCELIAGMHDEVGRVTLPGFYNSVQPIEVSERAELARLPMDEEFYLNQTGVPALYGEKGYTHDERVGARPTLEVNGILSGFTGEGSKTVLPAEAMAKISMRLVPDQNPDSVHQQFCEYLKTSAPKTVNWKVIKLASGPSSITDRNIPGVLALCKALESTWGVHPVFRREGGSIPVVGLMQKELGIESVLTGFGLSDDNLHAPNEKIHLPTIYRGIEAFIRYFSILAEEYS
jgi:acetylornithine deacetylase/succinyl-diaminopimelate desuccinylase-like protein